jgi:predicted O-methyltransferase YrrM
MFSLKKQNMFYNIVYQSLIKQKQQIQKKQRTIINHIHKYSFLTEEEKQNIQEIINKAKNIITNELLPIIKKLGEPLEGNIFMSHHTTEYTNEYFDKQVNFILAAKKENINSILEIGFNAGFSTLLILLTNEKVNITCVDICEHSYTKLCFQKLQEFFGNRIQLLSGSSVEVVPTLYGNRYDLIHIDGCHLVHIAELDIQNCLKLANSKTILIMDDTNDINLYKLWYYYVTKYNLQSTPQGQFINTNYHDIKIFV